MLVNNAGITKDGVFRKMSVQDWMAVIDTNLNSLFFVTKQVVDGMMDRGWGRIINISSMNGPARAVRLTNYSTAKAGMHGFDGAGAGSGEQGRDGEYRVAGLHRYRHGSCHSRRCAGKDRGDDSKLNVWASRKKSPPSSLAGFGQSRLLRPAPISPATAATTWADAPGRASRGEALPLFSWPGWVRS